MLRPRVALPAALSSVGLALCLAAASPRPAAAVPQQPLRPRETPLGSRRPDSIPGTLSISSSLRVAYLVKTANGEAAVIDGTIGKFYLSIPQLRLTEAGRRHPISFSPNGQRVAYVARVKDQSVMVIDGAEGPAFDHIEVGSAFFSADSKRATYIGTRGKQSVVVVDNALGSPYDFIGVIHPSFSADSKHVYYTARQGDNSVMVVDGKEVGSAEYVGDPVLSKQGGHYAYVVKRKDKWAVVLDGIEGAPYNSIGNNLIFSRDGNHLLYEGRADLAHVVVDGKPSAGFGSIQENSYALSANAEHVAFVAHSSGNTFWVLDGKPEKTYSWVLWDAVFDSAGKKLTYSAEEDRKRFVVTGGREGPRFDDITDNPQFAADGRVLYVAKRGAQQFVVVDTIATAFDAVSSAFFTKAGHLVIVAKTDTQWHVIVDGIAGAGYSDFIGPIVVSENGQRVAYAAMRQGKRLVSINEREGRLYDDVDNLTFSPDGKHVAYTAKRSNRYLVVVDGVESAEYDDILSFFRTDPLNPTTFSLLARRGNTDLRLTFDWDRP